MAWLYFLEVALTKLSIQFFLLRIFPSQLVQRILWSSIAFTALWGLAFVAGSLGQCTPTSSIWRMWDGMHEGRCIDVTAFTWTHAVTSICLDCWMIALPLWQITSLQMSIKKKIGVGLMFFVGTGETVISIVRLASLVSFSDSTNVTYDYFDVSIWSSIEITVGVICTCMPTIRQALVQMFPAMMSGSRAYIRRKTADLTSPTGAEPGPRRSHSHVGWRSKLSQSNGRSRVGSDPQHGYRFEGPNAGSTQVVVQGGHVSLSNSEKALGLMRLSSHSKGHFEDDRQIIVQQDRVVHTMGDVELDSVDGDGTSRSSDRGDEATLVELKDLSPKSHR